MKFEDMVNGGGGDIQADLVIAADGSRSRFRRLLVPSKPVAYAGYLTWRATISENTLSEEVQQAFNDKATSYKMHESFIGMYASQLHPNAKHEYSTFDSYVVPGEHGSLKPGETQINIVWYYDCPGGSRKLTERMTDIDGV